ncbi:MAG: hypothetical protein GY804_04690 [Alphaproteobacteria bacterium]|nr:hypothetical protein [Alphaproteobacteria bacterium]
MADINITGLPDAGAISAADILHISQTAVDYKITIDDMSEEFGKAEIFGLTEDSTPLSSYFLVEAIDSDINNNKKVSLANVGLLFQSVGFFTSASSIALTDVIIFRDGVDTTLSEITVSDLRSTLLDFSSLSALSSLANNDLFVVYDITGTDNKRITTSNLQQQMLDTSTLTVMPSAISTSDDMILYDDSANTAYQVSIATLDARWLAGGGGGGDAVLADTQEFTGTNTFSSASGIKFTRIAVDSTTTLTVDHPTVSFNNTISGVTASFTNVGGTSSQTGASVIKGVYYGSNTVAYSDRTLDIVNSGGFAWVEAKARGIRPSAFVDGYLGDSSTSERWTQIYGKNLDISTSAELPTNTTINTVGLMDGAEINPSILPLGTTSDRGSFLKATIDQLQDGTGANAAIFGELLGTSFKYNNASESIQFKNQNNVNQFLGTIENRGSFMIGGMLVQFGNCFYDSPRSGEFRADIELGSDFTDVYRAFGEDPTVMCTVISSTNVIPNGDAANLSSTASTLKMASSNDGGSTILGFNFIAIGQGA